MGIGIETILPNKIDRIAQAFSFTLKRNFNNIQVYYFLFVTFPYLLFRNLKFPSNIGWKKVLNTVELYWAKIRPANYKNAYLPE